MKEFPAERETGSDALLRELVTCQKKTLGQTRLAAAFTVLLAVLLLLALGALAVLVPRTLALEKQAKDALGRLDAITAPVESVIKNAESLLSEDSEGLRTSMQKLGELDLDSLSVTLGKLKELDLDGLNDTLKKLNGIDLDSLNEAIRKLNGIDLDSLNEAIINLNDAAKPLADLARRLSGG